MMSALREACAEIAQRITDRGLRCHDDPSRVRAGQAAIFPINITFTTLGTDDFLLECEVYVLGNNRDRQPVVMDTLFEALMLVRQEFEAPSAEAVTFELPDGSNVPGLRIPLTLNYSKE